MANQLENSPISQSKADASLHLSAEYQQLLANLKSKILSARLKAALTVNTQVIALYWHIGHEILARQQWGQQADTSHVSRFTATVPRNPRFFHQKP